MTITTGQLNTKNDGFPSSHKIPEWDRRRGDVFTTLRAKNIDILTLQECPEEVCVDLAQQFRYEYRHLKNPRNDKIQDGIAILYSSRFAHIDTRSCVLRKDKTHLLSKTEKIKLSENLNSGLFVDLKDTTTGKVIRVTTTHLKGGPTRQLGLNQLKIIEFWSQKDTGGRPLPDATIFSGDFNNNLRDDRLGLMTGNDYIALSTGLNSTELLPDGSAAPNRVLDHIFCKGQAQRLNSSAEFLRNSQRQPLSDHALVTATFALNSETQTRGSCAARQPYAAANGVGAWPADYASDGAYGFDGVTRPRHGYQPSVATKVEFSKKELQGYLRALGTDLSRGLSFKAKIFVGLMIKEGNLIRRHGKVIVDALLKAKPGNGGVYFNNFIALIMQQPIDQTEIHEIKSKSLEVYTAITQRKKGNGNEAEIIAYCMSKGIEITTTAKKAPVLKQKQPEKECCIQ